MAVNSTVMVEPVKGWPALKMTWGAQVNNDDVRRAFGVIRERASTAAEPTYVVVDVSSSPNVPLIGTMIGALSALKDANLAAWLVVGSNGTARTVKGLLSRVPGRAKVRCFDREVDALGYLVAARRRAARRAEWGG